jgi:hypothetical protein
MGRDLTVTLKRVSGSMRARNASRPTDQAESPSSPQRRRRAAVALRIAAGVVLFGGVLLAAIREWQDVEHVVARMSPFALAAALVLSLAALLASSMTWRRALQELGSKVARRSAAKIYLVGQLGKYVPGSIWALLVQAELGRRADVPRNRSVTAGVVSVGTNLATGLAVGLFLIPSVAGSRTVRIAVGVLVLVVMLVALSPPALTRLVNLLLDVTRRPRLTRPISWQGMARASAWSMLTWFGYGLALWVLVASAGAPALESLPICLAAVALSMTAGFLVVVAPAGIGVREAVLVASLSTVMSGAEALAVALVFRLVFTVADLVAATLAAPISIRPTEPIDGH